MRPIFSLFGPLCLLSCSAQSQLQNGKCQLIGDIACCALFSNCKTLFFLLLPSLLHLDHSWNSWSSSREQRLCHSKALEANKKIVKASGSARVSLVMEVNVDKMSDFRSSSAFIATLFFSVIFRFWSLFVLWLNLQSRYLSKTLPLKSTKLF